MMKYLTTLLVLLEVTSVRMQCIAKDESSKKYIKRLEPIKGKVFKYVYKDEVDMHSYEYQFSICSEVNSKYRQAGIIQTDLVVHKVYAIGRINSTSVKAGTDWMMLTYGLGDKYNSHCGNAYRQAHVVITCNANIDAGNFAVLYEENGHTTDCFYLMEMESKIACSQKPTGLSTGSILVIVVFSCFIPYLAIGMLYKRFVHGAKGFEQVPNIGCWRKCGNMQADGCDYLCRCQESGFDSSRPYRGIADEQLDDEADDENLLPM